MHLFDNAFKMFLSYVVWPSQAVTILLSIAATKLCYILLSFVPHKQFYGTLTQTWWLVAYSSIRQFPFLEGSVEILCMGIGWVLLICVYSEAIFCLLSESHMYLIVSLQYT